MVLNMKIIGVVLSCFIVPFSPLWAGTQFYGMDIDSVKWQTSGNRLECRLSQEIPGYGSVSFKHRALKSMEFRVSSNNIPIKASQALIYVAPPPWKRFANRKVLGRVSMSPQKDSIVVPEDWAYRIAFELREGMEARWSHANVGDGQDLVIAKALPFYFEAAWRDFKKCGELLIDYSYQDIKFFAFYYGRASVRLSQAEKAKLDKIAEYVALDPDYQYIKISSHTDSRGVRRSNIAMSQRRANVVKDYLVSKGVDAKSFRIVAQGEENPRYNNRTKAGRAKNRRVEVSLVK